MLQKHAKLISLQNNTKEIKKSSQTGICKDRNKTF